MPFFIHFTYHLIMDTYINRQRPSININQSRDGPLQYLPFIRTYFLNVVIDTSLMGHCTEMYHIAINYLFKDIDILKKKLIFIVLSFLLRPLITSVTCVCGFFYYCQIKKYKTDIPMNLNRIGSFSKRKQILFIVSPLFM